MKPIIVNMNEMSDSKEVYDSRPNKVLPFFIYVCTAMAVAAIVWMCLGKVEMTVTAGGMLRPDGTVGTVVNTVEGRVSSVYTADGAQVEAGEVIYVIEHENLELQQAFYEEQVSFYTERSKDEQGAELYRLPLQEAKLQLSSITAAIENCYVKSPCAGIVNLIQNPVEGNLLSAGAEVCSIMPPEEAGYKCIFYLGTKDIGSVTEGMRVKINISAFPAAEYGYVYGTVTKISPDVHVNAAGGMAYYQAEAVVDINDFVDGADKAISLRAGMECEVKIVKEEKKILTVVLEKLNLFHQ